VKKEKLDRILADHKLWLRGSGGARANLAGADLTGANLAGANLAGADLTGANLTRANLADAYLTGANLTRANLTGANLTRADLTDAYLTGADLADAYLTGANLARANLADAYLTGANLAGAYLTGANLARANLTGANLTGADLADAYLTDADLARANLADAQGEPPEPYQRVTSTDVYAKRASRYRERHPNVPAIENLDQKMLAAVTFGDGKLDMSQWHTCETTHCRAGWAIVLAGEDGKKLENEHGPAVAGRMIYMASTGRSAHFFASNEAAMTDIKRRAEETK
jgi:uncharacterized protein YjbI with pentapeptide repeats